MPSDFGVIASAANEYVVGNRTPSAALIAWFLENIWRLETDEVEEAICDGPGDKGIDALVVDWDASEVILVQGKRREQARRTQGDADLRSLVGAEAYFRSVETLDALEAGRLNSELRHLIRRSKVRNLLDGSHTVRLVFVTNSELDGAAHEYLEATQAAGHVIEVWSRTRLAEVAHRTSRPGLRPETVTLEASIATEKQQLTNRESMVLALIPAKQLVELPGILDLSLFDRNVRLYAGKTRINRELIKTITTPDEHNLFAAYHNGLTILTEGLTADGPILTLKGVGVVNGCQSLLTLADHQAYISSELKLVVKIVEVAESGDVSDQITHRSNNQNPVNMRDQRSTDPIMRDLQGQVRSTFGTQFDFSIRIGETQRSQNYLDNTKAAQLIVAVYLHEPAAAVRKVRLFEDEFRRIFSRNIDAHKLYLLHVIDQLIVAARGDLRPDLRASFAGIRFTLAYLLGQVLRLSPEGAQLLEDPAAYLPQQEPAVKGVLDILIRDIIESINFHVAESIEDDNDFDPKVAFKSSNGVRRAEQDVIKQSRRQARRDSDYLFHIAPTDTAS